MWLQSAEQRPPLYNLQHFVKRGKRERLENRDRANVDENKGRAESGLYSKFIYLFSTSLLQEKGPLPLTLFCDRDVNRCGLFLAFAEQLSP